MLNLTAMLVCLNKLNASINYIYDIYSIIFNLVFILQEKQFIFEGKMEIVGCGYEYNIEWVKFTSC